MTEHNPIQTRPAARSLRCEEWEALLTDALDGTLAAEDAAAFHAHGESCKACAATLEDTRKGQQWLQFLHTEPPVPGDLFARILARTSGAAAGVAAAGPLPAGVVAPGLGIPLAPVWPPLWKRISIPAMMRRAWEPSMMMTAAMAFFSIALTLNLVGVRVTAVRLADLKPNALQTNLRRSYNTANARVSRYYDNLRFVYEVESRMREMQRTSEADQPSQESPAQPSQQPGARKPDDKKTAPDGSAGKAPAPGGKSQSPRNSGSRAYLPGRTELASLEWKRHLSAAHSAGDSTERSRA